MRLNKFVYPQKCWKWVPGTVTYTHTHHLGKTFIDKVVEPRQHKLSDFKETKQIAEASTVAFFGEKNVQALR